jgi:transposase InsO family protein
MLSKRTFTDQGSKFMSDLIKQVCKLLTINKLCTTPYHPHAKSLVENFNGVLKEMLRSYAQKEPTNRKKLIPQPSLLTEKFQTRKQVFLLLNYYARHIKGTLAILKGE